jgi:hypothetical protein
MGRRGKLPERGLRRRKGRQAALDAATTFGEIEIDVEAPYEADPNWHPQAISLYESVQRSGQAEFYAESDWVKLYMVCDQLSLNLKPSFVGFADDWKTMDVEVVIKGVPQTEQRLVKYQRPISGVVPMNGATLNAIQSLMTSLGISEGDRRRMSMELVRTKKGKGAEEEAAAQARADAAMMEAMRTGKVVEGHFGQAAGE